MTVRRSARPLFRYAATAWGWLAFGASCAVWAVVAVPPTLLLRRVWPAAESHFRSATRAALWLYVRTLPFVRIEVEGAEQRLRGARVLVANHQSYLDPIFLLALEPDLAGPARDDLLRTPAVGAVMRMIGFYEAQGAGGGLGPLERAAEQARAGDRGLLFFPEGTRSRDGAVGAFRRGAFRIAVDHDLPIQPVVVEGMDRVLPPHSPVVQGGFRERVRLRYLPPVRPPYGAGLRRDVVRALAERVREEIVWTLERGRAEGEASGTRAGESGGP